MCDGAQKCVGSTQAELQHCLALPRLAIYNCNMEIYSAEDLIAITAETICDLATEARTFDPKQPFKQSGIISHELPAAVELMRVLQVVLWREEGLTWEQIGEALGTSHQAARQRYKPEIAALATDRGLITTAK